MLSRRPLLYLTIPSLAILIGLWFRRKKAIAAQCDKGGGKKGTKSVGNGAELAGKGSQEQSIFALSSVGAAGNGKPDISDSVPIGSVAANDETGLLNTSGGSNTSNLSGKSGPISIGPNSRSPPIPIANKGNCGHTSDELNSIDEFDVESSVSPVDLPGSYERRNFEFVKNSHLYNKRTKGGSMEQQPKVITACKSPKISPKNAFSEANSPSPTQEQPKTPTDVPVVQDELMQSQVAKLSLAEDVQKTSNKRNNNKAVGKENVAESDTKSTTTIIRDQTNRNGKLKNVEQKQQKGENIHTINNNTGTQEQPLEQSTTAISTTAADSQPPSVNSPPLSLYSVHSNDSGKGSSPTQSDVEAITSSTANQSSTQCYEFLINEKYAGMLIGYSGQITKKVWQRFSVNMVVRQVPNCPRPTDRVCAMTGAPADVEAALKFIRQRLNLKKYPDISFERVYYSTQNGGVKPADGGNNKKPVMPIVYPVAQLPLSLSLVEGINNDVVISAIQDGGHVFLQQPSHPSHQQLGALHTLLNTTYASDESPTIEHPAPGSICVAPVGGIWYRVVIVSNAMEQCLVKFLDFGGSVLVPAADLRQIRTDFMTVPFQCIECVLSNLRPMGGVWSPAATELVLKLSNGLVLQAQVAGYTSEGLPEIFLYSILGPDNIAFINQELVAQGFAEWVEDESVEDDETTVDSNQQAPVLVQ